MNQDLERGAKLAQAGYAEALEYVMDMDDDVENSCNEGMEGGEVPPALSRENASGEYNHIEYVDSDDDMEAHALRKEAVSIVLYGEGNDERDDETNDIGTMASLPALESRQETAPAPRKSEKQISLAPGAYSVIGSLAIARCESGSLTPTRQRSEQSCIQGSTDVWESSSVGQNTADDDTNEQKKIYWKRRIVVFSAIFVIVAIAVGLRVGLSKRKPYQPLDADINSSPTHTQVNKVYSFAQVVAACDKTGRIPTSLELIPPIATTRSEILIGELPELSFLGSFYQECNPQALAFWWLVGDDEKYSVAVKLERYILVLFYFATGGKDWTLDSRWLSNKTMCDWEGINCYSDMEVVSDIILVNNDLYGSLPTELAMLTNLTRLVLSGNVLIGLLPSEIGALSKLVQLTVSNNNLSGKIPTQIGLLTDMLEGLDLGYNTFTGVLPSEIGKMTILSALDISRNGMMGALPLEIWQLTNLQLLDISFISIATSLATEIGLLTNLKLFAASSTLISGTLPTTLGACTDLTALGLQFNDMIGTIPLELGNLTHLVLLALEGNHLSGTVPTDICALTSLDKLTVVTSCLSTFLSNIYCPEGCCVASPDC